ncbi:MAG: hypothetical protein ACRDOS_03740 [Gaiellaceae bacterium]|jgi:hypothetical protein
MSTLRDDDIQTTTQDTKSLQPADTDQDDQDADDTDTTDTDTDDTDPS